MMHNRDSLTPHSQGALTLQLGYEIILPQGALTLLTRGSLTPPFQCLTLLTRGPLTPPLSGALILFIRRYLTPQSQGLWPCSLAVLFTYNLKVLNSC